MNNNYIAFWDLTTESELYGTHTSLVINHYNKRKPKVFKNISDLSLQRLIKLSHNVRIEAQSDKIVVSSFIYDKCPNCGKRAISYEDGLCLRCWLDKKE